MTPEQKKAVDEILPHAKRSQAVANALLKCASDNGWTDAELIIAVPMAVAIITPIEHLDMIKNLMQQMCDGRIVGKA